MSPPSVPCPGGPPWDGARLVVSHLRQAGHEAWMVGGCVRDLILGLPVHDVDITTNARPDQIEALFPHTIPVGKSFGVVVVVLEGRQHVEVATFRNDGAYLDGRHPTAISHGTAREDVERRDFTINALLYDPDNGNILDHVGGLDDLTAQRLRTVGDPSRRFAEDHLRILRCLRFAARLDFAVETTTWLALTQGTLAGLSAERIVQEWEKALLGPRCGRWLGLLADSGHLPVLFPPGAVPEAADRDRLTAAFDRLAGNESLAVKQALWLHTCPLPAVAAWLAGLPGSRERRERILWLVAQDAPEAILAWPVARRRRLLIDTAVEDLLCYLRCRHCATPALTELFRQAEDQRRNSPWCPLIRAKDLMELGVGPGPQLGRMLTMLEDAQLENAFSTRDEGLTIARQYLMSMQT